MSFQVVGHRGARGLFPENTLAGFRQTVALGVRRIELDVGVLKDGTVVVHHDFALNPDIVRLGERWLSGSLPLLQSLTLEDIEDFDVGRLRPGSETAGRFPAQQAVDGERIPTLAAVLAIDPSITWVVELKLQPDRPDWTVTAEEMVARVLEVVDAAGAAERVVLQSFDWRAPRCVRRVRPEVAVAWLTRAETVADAGLWWGPGFDGAASGLEGLLTMDDRAGAWSPHHTELTVEQVAQARAGGVAVVPWTVNEADDLRRLIGWGVDSIITDYPDRALQARP